MRHLSDRSRRILEAAVSALRPRGHGFDLPIDPHVVDEVDRTIACWPPLLKLAFPLGLRLLEWSPLFLSRSRQRLTRMDRKEAAHYLESCLESRRGPIGTVTAAVRTLVLVAFYQHPEVLRTLGVDGEARLEETVRWRARVLEEEGSSR
jgi:hypothetical protein